MHFVYRVVAKRKDFEAERLEVCEAARADPYLYPEHREELLREYETKQTRSREQLRRMHASQGRQKQRVALDSPQVHVPYTKQLDY